MSLLDIKEKKNSFSALNEREIQERLYGKYHKDASQSSVKPFSIEKPKLSLKKEEPAGPSLSEQLKPFFAAFGHGAARLKEIFPWKAVLAFAAAVLVLTFFVRAGLQLLEAKPWESWMKASKTKAETRISPVKQNVSAPVKKVQTTGPVAPASVSGPVSSQKAAVTSNSASGISETGVPKQKFFGVQICTYQRERDAQVLVDQLNQMQFSAFYRKSGSRDERIPLYVVFLDQAKTYAEAKEQLARFQKTEVSRQFSDAFIRSL